MDGLRGAFALSVLVFHALSLPDDVARLVRFFFLLSSFLLTLSLLRDRVSAPLAHAGFWRIAGRFWRKRAVRIAPAYFVVLAIVVLLDMPEVRATLYWHLSFTSNMLFAQTGEWRPWPLAHFWTIAVEEQFYIAWPFVILLASRRGLAIILAAMTLVAVAWKAWAASAGAPVPTMIAATWASLDAFALGAAVALALASGAMPLVRLRRSLGAASVGVAALTVAFALGVGPQGPVYRHAILDTLLLLPLAWGLIMVASGGLGPAARILGAAPLVWLGRISYGVYLYHLPVMIWLVLAGVSPMMTLLVGAPVSIAAAALSYRFIEEPASRFRPQPLRIPPSRGGAWSPS